MLTGGESVIGKFRPTILMEIETRHLRRYGHSAETVVDWLLRRGYTMHLWDHGWRAADGVRAQHRNYLFRAL